MSSPFEDPSSPWTGPPLTEDMVRQAEGALGLRLPQSYVSLLSQQNGGVLKNNCFPTTFPTSWSASHFEVDVIKGVGYPEGVDATSAYLVSEWGYPDVGVVIAVTPAAGPDTVMLDYSGSGPTGEPAVVYVDEDRVPRRIADSFQDFFNGLVSCDQFEDEDEDED
ncbi:SMI1/KNR4 family protein [Jidongwangia harbinensis]|uniref:SMI1/KNR4 family protein n=1 Tax=Jidongwangia harbinensis TaxID=2878561 RepID=UPI001CD9F2D4|nr:SMI1/KNR4 family protein [Jidongwangia harbinensis]MCA2213286.1 SMI1/KNR4 family protein [Jidongwangia harbinensis]